MAFHAGAASLTGIVQPLLGTWVFLGVGSYAAAALDGILGRVVAREDLQLLEELKLPLRTGALLLLQQRSSTERPDAALWSVAPALLAASAATATALVPLDARSAALDVPAGIVYFGAAMALVMVAVFMEGWSANSALPLVGGYRFIAQALSYEMPLALVLIATALPAESLAIGAIVRSQQDTWNVVRQPLGLPVYLVAAAGLAFWGPLGLSDARDLATGVRAELSGMALLLWRAAHLAVVVAVSSMGAAIFLGGWLGPWLSGPVWMALKTLVLVVLILVSGHTLARIRLEWFVRIAWTVLIPLALVDVFASGVLALVGSSR